MNPRDWLALLDGGFCVHAPDLNEYNVSLP